MELNSENGECVNQEIREKLARATKQTSKNDRQRCTGRGVIHLENRVVKVGRDDGCTVRLGIRKGAGQRYNHIVEQIASSRTNQTRNVLGLQ